MIGRNEHCSDDVIAAAAATACCYFLRCQRNEDRRKEIEGMMAIVAKADALDPQAVEKVFASKA